MWVFIELANDVLSGNTNQVTLCTEAHPHTWLVSTHICVCVCVCMRVYLPVSVHGSVIRGGSRAAE